MVVVIINQVHMKQVLIFHDLVKKKNYYFKKDDLVKVFKVFHYLQYQLYGKKKIIMELMMVKIVTIQLVLKKMKQIKQN